MNSRRLTWLTTGLCLLALTLVPLRAALGQCGGYCQSAGSCPGSGYNCGSGLCCYCCETCEEAVCKQVLVCWIATDPPVPVYQSYRYDQLWYDCYRGNPCTYYGQESQAVCNDNCPVPAQC